ncbi:MAG: imidazole glycerol phosphate synthase subunit HisH [Clostridia bacterium]|nr:imidazole glycerol phosphate synthase subunit HisH [Clostridia bacterium]MBQ8600371.1 imidazole glycerol phosphate synthase subunit HisH [Clostridia bacterium]
MIGIIDYGCGNLFSLKSSFEAIGEEVFVSGDAAKLQKADRLVLPGVGAFGDAAHKLKTSGLDRFVKEQAASGKPLMGICLGMQMLFEKSYEYGVHEGLGLLKGQVVPMEGVLSADLKIPHIGWNGLHLMQPDCPLFKNIGEGDHVYFVHSFYAEGCKESLAATAEYGRELTAAVAKGNIFGCQFHPEKSGKIGLAILKAFSEV